MILEIPRIAPSPNELLGKHWRVRFKNQQTWRQEIYYAVRAARVAGDARVLPYPKARVSIERRSRGTLDEDNLYGSAKPVIDGLRYAYVIVDDSPNHIRLTVTQSRGKARTRIEVTPA